MAECSPSINNVTIEEIRGKIQYFNGLAPDEYPLTMFRDLVKALMTLKGRLYAESPTDVIKTLLEWMELYNKLQDMINPAHTKLAEQSIKAIPAVLVFVLGFLEEKYDEMPNFHFKLLTLIYKFLLKINLVLLGKKIKMPNGAISCVWYAIKLAENYNTQLLALRVFTILLKSLDKQSIDEELENINCIQKYNILELVKNAITVSNYHPSTFNHTARDLLNRMNMLNLAKSVIYSLSCISMHLGDEIQFFKPLNSNHFWVDFNSTPSTVTFMSRCRPQAHAEFENVSVVAKIKKLLLQQTTLLVYFNPPVIYSKNIELLNNAKDIQYFKLELSYNEATRFEKRGIHLKNFDTKEDANSVLCTNEDVSEYSVIMNSLYENTDLHKEQQTENEEINVNNDVRTECTDQESLKYIDTENITAAVEKLQLQDNINPESEVPNLEFSKISSSTPVSQKLNSSVIATLSGFDQTSPISTLKVGDNLQQNVKKPRLCRQLFNNSENKPKTRNPRKTNKKTNKTASTSNILSSSNNNILASQSCPNLNSNTQQLSKENNSLHLQNLNQSVSTQNAEVDAPYEQEQLIAPCYNIFRKFSEKRWTEFIKTISPTTYPKLYDFIHNDDGIFTAEQRTNLLKLMLQIPQSNHSKDCVCTKTLKKCHAHLICGPLPYCMFKPTSENVSTLITTSANAKELNEDHNTTVYNLPLNDVTSTTTKIKRTRKRKVVTENNDVNVKKPKRAKNNINKAKVNNSPKKRRTYNARNKKSISLNIDENAEKTLTNRTKGRSKRQSKSNQSNEDQFFTNFFKSSNINCSMSSEELDIDIHTDINNALKPTNYNNKNKQKNLQQELPAKITNEVKKLQKTATPDVPRLINNYSYLKQCDNSLYNMELEQTENKNENFEIITNAEEDAENVYIEQQNPIKNNAYVYKNNNKESDHIISNEIINNNEKLNYNISNNDISVSSNIYYEHSKCSRDTEISENIQTKNQNHSINYTKLNVKYQKTVSTNLKKQHTTNLLMGTNTSEIDSCLKTKNTNSRFDPNQLTIRKIETVSKEQITPKTIVTRRTNLVNKDMFILPRAPSSNQKKLNLKPHDESTNSLIQYSSFAINKTFTYNNTLPLNIEQESTNLIQDFKNDICTVTDEFHEHISTDFVSEKKKEISNALRDVLQKSKEKDEIENELSMAISAVYSLYAKYKQKSNEFTRTKEEAAKIFQNLNINNITKTNDNYIDHLLNAFDKTSVEMRKFAWKIYVDENLQHLINEKENISKLDI